MKSAAVLACLIGATLVGEPVLAQATLQMAVGGVTPPPVPIAPPAAPGDSPEEIAKDAAGDLKDNRFYNRPGATRAQYEADWQECRLIARGSRTPAGTVPYFYNPAVVSPLAAGVGGALGGLIAGMIQQGQQRRANRRSCLLIRGWRLVEVPPAQAVRVAAMKDNQRSAYFDTIVGAATVEGKVTERTSFSLAPDPALALDALTFGPGQLFVGKKIAPNAPFALELNEAAVVVAFRRPDAGSAGRAGVVQLARYDVATRDLVYQPKNAKKLGDKTVYLRDVASADGKAPYEVQLVRVTPGDYVISALGVNTKLVTSSNCFGAPTFHVGAGEVAYLGDFIPYWNVKLASGDKVSALAYTSHIDDARRVLGSGQPALAKAMTAATLRNRATYACSAITMDRWDIAGRAALPEVIATK